MAALTGKAFAETAQEYDDAGMALFRAGLYDKSLQYFSSAVQTDPQDWQGYQDMGDAYMKLDNKQSALQSYQQALQINPNIPGLQTTVNNLSGQVSADSNTDNGDQQPQASTPPPPNNNGYSNQPGSSVVVVQHRPWRRARVVRTYKFNDNLALIDHAPIWSKLQLGYTYAQLGDLTSGAANINNGTYVNADPNLPPTSNGAPLPGYTGSASASNSGLHVGGEVGFLFNPYMGIGLGFKYLQMADYNANVVYNNTAGDYENATFTPELAPITLDYYLFLPDSGGRFYIKGGVGYYFSAVHVDETYSTANFYNQDTNSENWDGDLYSGNVGFQLGVGREFAISDQLGIELYAEGRFVQISNYKGTLYDQNGNSSYVGLTSGTSNGTVDFDNPAFINAANGERYANLNFTGVDVGFSINWYTF